MAGKRRPVTGGVDTHGKTHHAAVVDDTTGQLLGDKQFEATMAGYQALLAWIRTFGRPTKIGVEGTGAYGAGLARYLASQDVEVVEVDRPDRKTRRQKGKSDPIDAISAAQAVLSGRASGVPKARNGRVEAIRVLRVARASAVKARTAAINQLRSLVVSAPEPLRADLTGLTKTGLVRRCATLAINEANLDDPSTATAAALQTIATRVIALDAEINQADARLKPLVHRAAPRLSAIFGVGPDVAGQLLVTAGDNPERLRSEAALAHLCGIAPIPASSGRQNRHRLNRGGDRQANKAIYTIVLTRLAKDPRTQAYKDRRTKHGLSPKEIIRCLKRYVVREIHTALLADYASTGT